jgi:hypothetical protein
LTAYSEVGRWWWRRYDAFAGRNGSGRAGINSGTMIQEQSGLFCSKADAPFSKDSFCQR